MMHSTCIAAFRAPARKRHHGAAMPAAPGLTALAEREIHRCVLRQATEGAIPAYYTLCGYLVPAGNVGETCIRVTCPKCLGHAEEHGA